jgi:hypothetical protein
MGYETLAQNWPTPPQTRRLAVPAATLAAAAVAHSARPRPNGSSPACTFPTVGLPQFWPLALQISDFGGAVVGASVYRPSMDGSGYPLRQHADGSVVRTAPDECPNGHPLRYPNVLVGWSPPAGMLGVKYYCAR